MLTAAIRPLTSRGLGTCAASFSRAFLPVMQPGRRLALDVDPSALASVTELAMASSPADASTQPTSDPASSRSGGGQVIPIPGGTPASRGLARAALALDGLACQQIMRDTIEKRGVIWSWDHLLVPVLTGVGQRWETSGGSIDVEHILSDSVHAVLAERARELKEPQKRSARDARRRG